MIIEMLPLEMNAKLTEINKWLALSGSSCISYRGLKVDIATSVFAVLSSIDVMFPDCCLPFCIVYDRAYDFVIGYRDHIEAKYKKYKKEV